MIIKEISTQSVNEDGTIPYLFRNSEDYTPEEWDRKLRYLERNAEARILRYEVVESTDVEETLPKLRRIRAARFPRYQ